MCLKFMHMNTILCVIIGGYRVINVILMRNQDRGSK